MGVAVVFELLSFESCCGWVGGGGGGLRVDLRKGWGYWDGIIIILYP